MALQIMDVNRAPAVTGNFLALGANPIVAVALKIFATTADMEFVNDGQTLLFVDNQQAAATTTLAFTIPNLSKDGVTFAASGQAAFAVTADTLAVFGPFPPATYNNTAGKVVFTVTPLTTSFVFVISINK